MARLIDVLQQPRPLPRETARPVVLPEPQSGDEAVARGIMSFGAGVQSAANEIYRAQKIEEDRIDTLRAEEAFTQLRERQLDLTVGKDNGFANRRGAAAVNQPLYPDWMKRFEDATKEISGTLNTPTQKERFGLRANVARLQFQEDVLKHLAHEGDSYAREVYTSILSSEQGNALARWNDPNGVGAALVRINAAIDREAERSGWAQEDIAATKEAQASQIHRGVIGMMATNGKEEEAQRYYDAVKGELAAGDQLAVQSTLQQARSRIEELVWEDFAEGVQIAENAVFMDPAQFDAEFGINKVIIDNLEDVSERNRVKFRRDLYERLAAAKVLGMARTDPEGTEAMLRGALRRPSQPVPAPKGWTPFGGTPQVIDGMTEAGNINLSTRPVVRNQDGSISTVRSMSFNENGVEILIPTVVGGRVVSDEAAIAEYQRSGQHLGKFSSPQAATSYADALHKQQQALYEGAGAPNRAVLEAYAAEQERAYGLPTGLLRGLIDRESNWDQAAKSPKDKGAIGLGQLMPGTAADEGVDPTDPYQNIRGAASYLSKQLRQHDGNVALALAAYNAGPAAVAKYGGIPPFPETQAYVPSVQASAEQYRMRPPPEVPEGMATTSTGDEFIDRMPLDLRMKLLREVTTLGNQRQARAKGQLKNRLEDFVAMAHSGVDIPLAAIPTPQELTLAYGPQDGAVMWREVQGSLQLNEDIKQVRGMPYPQQNDLLLKRTPVPGEGYLDAAKRQESLARAVDYVRREQKDDPAGWTLRNTKPVRDAWTRAQDAIQAQDPVAARQALDGYAVATLAEQDRIGMAPKILPNDVAQSVVRQFYMGQKQGGQNAAQLIGALSQQWGKHWSQVYGQIAKEIPASARTIGAGMPEPAAMTLAGIADVKREELLTGLPSGTSKDVNDRLSANFERAHLSLLATEPRSGQQNFEATYRDAEKLAFIYVAQGKSPAEAADQAYEETFAHRYEFVQSGPAFVRVPKGPEWQTGSAISKGATSVRDNVGALDLAIPKSLAGLPPGDARRQWVDVLAAGAYWVTAPDESGLMLYDPHGAAVLDSKGAPIWRSWYALYQAGRPVPGPQAERGYGRAPAPAQPTLGAPEAPRARTVDEIMSQHAADSKFALQREDIVLEEMLRGQLMLAAEGEAQAGADEEGGIPPVVETPSAVPMPPRPPPVEGEIPPIAEPRGAVPMPPRPKSAEPLPTPKPQTKPAAPQRAKPSTAKPTKPAEKPKTKPESFEGLERRLRDIARRENLAGQHAARVRESGDQKRYEWRIKIIDKLYQDRQEVLQRLRKLDPKRAERVYNELYRPK